MISAADVRAFVLAELESELREVGLTAGEVADGLDLIDAHVIDSFGMLETNAAVRAPSGAEVDFTLDGVKGSLRIFTTRPDTLFGATYMVLAPEHALVEVLTSEEQRAAVHAYREATTRKSDLARQEDKVKTGVFTGGYAINPVNGEKLPVWIADYVLMGYGPGAIMAEVGA